MKPGCSVIEVCTHIICASGSNTYDAQSESGLIRTSTTKVDASQAEVKQSGNVKWDNWE